MIAIQRQIINSLPRNFIRDAAVELSTSPGYIKHVLMSRRNPDTPTGRKILRRAGEEAAKAIWLKSWEEQK